jgi:hypothetical protein
MVCCDDADDDKVVVLNRSVLVLVVVVVVVVIVFRSMSVNSSKVGQENVGSWDYKVCMYIYGYK